MSIMTRFVRLFQADVHGVMDSMEDKTLVLKQSLREMEAILDDQNRHLKKMKAERDAAAEELARYKKENDAAEADLEMAVQKERDDIARFLIRKQKNLLRHRDHLQSQLENLEAEIGKLKEEIEERRRQYDDLRLRAKTYLSRQDIRRQRTDDFDNGFPDAPGISDEEVELELLRRKERMEGHKRGEERGAQ